MKKERTWPLSQLWCIGFPECTWAGFENKFCPVLCPYKALFLSAICVHRKWAVNATKYKFRAEYVALQHQSLIKPDFFLAQSLVPARIISWDLIKLVCVSVTTLSTRLKKAKVNQNMQA